MGAGDDTSEDVDAHARTAISSPGVDVRPSKTDAFIGRVLAERYQVLELLGRGGMGSVYIGEHIQLKKRVALKVLSEHLDEQPELVERFLKEARAAAQIGHANIVDVFDLGQLPEGGAYIAMALLEGNDLEVEIEKNGAMSLQRACRIVAEICRALAAAHSKGIVHRDMKPANVFLARDGEGGEHVKVLDFGIAQIQSGEDARLTQTGAIVGTPAFMSPEQGRGERPDHRTDIYSVGCIFYTLVTGNVPFQAGTLMGVITKHILEPVDPPSTRRPDLMLPPGVDEIIDRAMAKKPADRFQTMKDMWTALESLGGASSPWPDAASGNYTPLAPSGTTGRRLPASVAQSQHLSEVVPPRSRTPLLFIGGIAIAICAGAFAWLGRSKPTPAPIVSAPVQPADVTVEIRSTPPGAKVSNGDTVLGTTPLHLSRPRSSETLVLTLSTDGCINEPLQVDLDRDRVFDVHLRPDTHVEPTGTPPVESDPKPQKASHAPKPPKPTPTHSAKAGRDGQLKDPFAQ